MYPSHAIISLAPHNRLQGFWADSFVIITPNIQMRRLRTEAQIIQRELSYGPNAGLPMPEHGL